MLYALYEDSQIALSHRALVQAARRKNNENLNP
jgi:hypothetical protein